MASEKEFEQHRPRLLAMAHRMLGSRAEAEDAVQETWLRLSRSSPAEIENLGGWLTTVVARISLNLLRSRRSEPLASFKPFEALEPFQALQAFQSFQVSEASEAFEVELIAPDNPEQEAVLADEIGLAMLVVLAALTPAERLAFVLHDMFAVPFPDIAGIVGRTPAATRQLASRARRRVQEAPVPTAGPALQRAAVDAFFAAARNGNFEQLVALLDPEIVLRQEISTVVSGVTSPREAVPSAVHGADSVARNAIMFADPSAELRAAVINGGVGVVVLKGGKPFSAMRFTIVAGRIAAIDVETSADRLRQIAIP